MDKAASSIWKREGVEADKLGSKRDEETRGEERLNMTVTGAEPSSPSREAARGNLNYFHFKTKTHWPSTFFLKVLVLVLETVLQSHIAAKIFWKL